MQNVLNYQEDRKTKSEPRSNVRKRTLETGEGPGVHIGRMVRSTQMTENQLYWKLFTSHLSINQFGRWPNG